MYSKILIPLDGSPTAEQVLPYARALTDILRVPIELLAVVETGEMGAQIATSKARFLETMMDEATRSSSGYLKGVAARTGSDSQWTVEKGKPEEIIIQKAAGDKTILIAMATHGRSGLDRWMLGSVTEKVLRGCENPLLVVRAVERLNTEEKRLFKCAIVPLDGSELAERVLPAVLELAQATDDFEMVLFRAYNLPYSVYSETETYSAIDFEEILSAVKEEAVEYLEKKTAEMKRLGVKNVSYIAKDGIGADEIITLGRTKPHSLITMCSHGRSGFKRWVLGSVAETVVRHSQTPVLVLRAN
jgi:nucleotide-binding universal stress UspA family protein